MKVHLPDRDEAPADVQPIFDSIEKALGFLPNFALMLSHSPHVLRSYLHLSGGQEEGTAFSLQEREVMLLAVSEFHGSPYCLAAHSAYARSAGFSDAELLAFRAGKGDDERMRFLAGFARMVAEQRGKLTRDQLDDFADWGYGAPALLDVVTLVIESTFSNYVSLLTKVPVDFPEVEWVE